MNFQSHQALAKANTAQLLFYLSLGTLGLVMTVSALSSVWFYAKVSIDAGNDVAIMSGVLTLVAVALASIVKGAQIRHEGGNYLAASLGGWPITFATHDHAERQLINIVEELAVASGMPVPALFVLPEERGINAFAAGWNADNAVIGVTRGALFYLTRDELQAVIAHEFSHIANGDMRVKTRTISWVYGISALAVLGRVMFRSLHATGRDPISLLLVTGVGSLLSLVGWIGGWFGHLMQAAVNREREYLADASAVQFTRNPDGLASALVKIGALGAKNELRSPRAEEAAHLFFQYPYRNNSTHPPLRKRIRLLNMEWDGAYPSMESIERSANHNIAISHLGMPLPDIFDLPGLKTAGAAGVDAALDIPGADALSPLLESGVGAALLLDSGTGSTGSDGPQDASSPRGFHEPTLGPPTHDHVEYAQKILAWIPQNTKDFLHTSQGAVAAVVGLLASSNPTTRTAELDRVSEMTGFPQDYLEAASTMISSLDRPLQLAAIDIALHSIHQTPRDFQAELSATIHEFSTTNPTTDLFRWILRRVVLRHLDDVERTGDDPEDVHDLESLSSEAALMYRVIAGFNSAGAESLRESFGAAHVRAGLRMPASIPTAAELSFERLDIALEKLAKMNHEGRIAFVEGAIAAVRLDAHTSANEAELIRVVADAVGIAMPPMLPVY